MINDDLELLIEQNFPHKPTFEQQKAIQEWISFLLERSNDEVFILKGFAGTGKTTLVGALVKTLKMLKQPVILMAPTGRAAKVFAMHAETSAYTIHKKIYRQKSLDNLECFQANINLHKHTLFIVDEASMIANEGLSGSMFGTGRLLDDLMHFVYSCEGCRLMLVGDTAQLPPIGEENSPALNSDILAGYSLNVHEICLTQVVRQQIDSGILWNATMLRKRMQNEDVFSFPQFRICGFPDICVVSGEGLIDALESSYAHCGIDSTIVVTRSNKRAAIFNQGIRGRILDYQEELCGNDIIMVAKNNYYWVEQEKGMEKGKNTSKEDMTFIANGDIAIVRRFRNERCFYGFRFADVTLRFPDYDNREMETTVLLDTLQSEAPALTRNEQEDLFRSVWEDYPEIRLKKERIKKIKEDPYYNALQIKYAYAVTCHKAQGGQWEHVYIDQGYLTEEMLSADYFRWLYTALTRATEKVFLINWPTQQLQDGY